MDDLISRTAVLDAIGGMKPMPSSMEQLVMKSLCWAAVKTIQPVDAVPVVQCVGCRYCVDADRGTPYDGDEEWYCRRWERYASAYSVDPYRHFCAAGEKREVKVKDVVCGGDGFGTE